VEESWLERFLDYSAQEGPVREPTISMKGLEGAFIAFGIGHNICPGRHFALRAILNVVSSLVFSLDFEPTSDAGWDIDEKDYRTFGYAVCRPERPIPFRVRRTTEVE
jgi:cytochrome P450